MTKTERNEMIIKLATNGKTKSQIVDEIKRLGGDVSERTVQRVISDSGLMHSQVCLPPDKIGQNGFFVSQEMWETLLDKIDSLLDTIDIQNAKISNLEADVIKTNVISTNGITSSKKYKVVYGDDREPVFCDYLELPKALPVLTENSSKGFYNMYPERRIDKNIKEDGKFNVFTDCAYVVYTTEKTFEDMHQQMINANDDNIKESDKQIDDMQRRLFGYTGSNNNED